MPDNDNNDLRNRLAVIEQQFGLSTTNDNSIQANTTTDNLTAHINWKALYKWLESEVEELIFDPNATPFVKSWATRLLENAREKMDRFTR
jgi:hypothetical protein